jgi:hypothetical protein
MLATWIKNNEDLDNLVSVLAEKGIEDIVGGSSSAI